MFKNGLRKEVSMFSEMTHYQNSMKLTYFMFYVLYLTVIQFIFTISAS